PETQNIEIEEPETKEISTFQTSSKKNKQYKTTDAKEQILKQLKDYKNTSLLSLEIVNGLVKQLVEVEQSSKLSKY
ncbi:25908_t:CDS:1, partial [Racocetra persica]